MSAAARKRAIYEGARPVSGYESEASEAINNLADAARTLAGAFCTLAAASHTKTPGEQRDMAAVFYDDASHRFGDITRRMDKKQRADLNAFIDAMCKGKK